MQRTFAALIALLLLACPAIASASTDNLTYTFKQGDTLIGLGKKYLLRASDYQAVQKANGISDANLVPIGKQIRIARFLLKYRASSAELISVRGDVTIVRDGNQSTAASGSTISEGTTIRTAASSFATLSLENGSRVALPSNSDLRIIRLRRYLIDSSLDYEFNVGKGGARSKVTPLNSQNDRYVVRTPKAVSAVRGTDFESRFDDTAGDNFAEVVEGGLAVDLSDGQALQLPVGKGLAVNAAGMATVETLLPTPNIANPGKLQADDKISFGFTEGGSGHRVQISSDAGFIDQIADIRTGANPVILNGLVDGNYFVRARAISATGIEGFPVTLAFKRRQNSIAGAASKSEAGYSFKWAGNGAGVRRYHFQLFLDSTDSTAFVDQPGLIGRSVTLSDLPPGDYYWRVGAQQFGDGEINENWTDFEKLSVSAP